MSETQIAQNMKRSWNRNDIHIAGNLWGESMDHQWIPLIRGYTLKYARNSNLAKMDVSQPVDSQHAGSVMQSFDGLFDVSLDTNSGEAGEIRCYKVHVTSIWYGERSTYAEIYIYIYVWDLMLRRLQILLGYTLSVPTHANNYCLIKVKKPTPVSI